MFEQDFESMLCQYIDTIDDKKRFIGLVKDYFSDQAKNINLLLIAYSLGIAQDIKNASRIGNTFAYRYVKQLMDDYGISRVNADWVVSVWCVCLGQKVLGKECDIRLQEAGAGPAVKEETGSNMSYGDLFHYSQSTQGNGLAVCGFDGNKDQTIIFQNKANNKSVIEVGGKSFASTGLQEAILTDGIAFLGAGVFEGCSKLHQVVLPYSMREIGDRAMKDCSMMKSVSLPDGLERIGDEAFKRTGLRTINIPRTVYWLGNGVFEDCMDLDQVKLPKNIDRIPARTFAGCTSLRKFEMSNSVTSIGENAFFGCENMDIIVIPESVQQIGTNAFTGTNKLFLIQCVFGSYAEEYARKHKIKYQLI